MSGHTALNSKISWCNERKAECEARLKVAGICESMRNTVRNQMTVIDQRLSGLEARRERVQIESTAGRNITLRSWSDFPF